jgi:hypothetical protein
LKCSYEKRISELTLNLQKHERDLAFRDEELRAMRKYAEEAAKNLEPLRKRELKLELILKERDHFIVDIEG